SWKLAPQGDILMLLAPVRRLARWLMIVGVATGFAAGTVAAALILLAGVWLDVLWELPPGARVANSVLAALAPVPGIGFGVFLAWRRGQPLQIAKRIDRAAAADGQIRAAIDLELQPPHNGPLAVSLARLAGEKALVKVRQISTNSVVPLRPLGRACAALAG